MRGRAVAETGWPAVRSWPWQSSGPDHGSSRRVVEGPDKSGDAGRNRIPASSGSPPSLKPGSLREVTSLVLDPVCGQTLYVGTSCGVFGGTDGARAWRAGGEGRGEAAAGLLAAERALSLDPRARRRDKGRTCAPSSGHRSADPSVVPGRRNQRLPCDARVSRE